MARIKQNPLKKASEIANEKSRNNIETKIQILLEWSENDIAWQTNADNDFIRNSDGDKIVEWFPKNILQFCKWNGSQNSAGTLLSLPPIRTLSRDTFYKKYNADLKNHFEQILPSLIALEDKMLAESTYASVIKKLEKDIVYWKALAESEATHVLMTLKKLDTIDIKYRKSVRARTNNETELKNKIDELTIENSVLNKLISKVKGLKVVK